MSQDRLAYISVTLSADDAINLTQSVNDNHWNHYSQSAHQLWTTFSNWIKSISRLNSETFNSVFFRAIPNMTADHEIPKFEENFQIRVPSSRWKFLYLRNQHDLMIQLQYMKKKSYTRNSSRNRKKHTIKLDGRFKPWPQAFNYLIVFTKQFWSDLEVIMER